MLLSEFDAGVDAPPGASAVVDGETLVLRWPSTADDRRLPMAVVGGVSGVVASGFGASAFPGMPGLLPLLVVAAFAGLGLFLARFLPRSFVTLTATPGGVRVSTSGVLLDFPAAVSRAELLDVLVIEEQDGKLRDGTPIMVHRLVAPRQGGGRTLLVKRLTRAEFGQWAEACYARWAKQRRARSA